MAPLGLNNSQKTLRVLAWLLVVCEVLCISSRLVLKKVIMGGYGWDDATITLAVLFSLAASIAAFISAAYGLGQDAPQKDDRSLKILQQTAYVSEIFHVLCLCTIKLSVLVFIRKVFSARLKGFMYTAILGSVVAWGLSSVLVVALQCHAPRVWDLALGVCVDMGAFWTYFSVLDIVMDLVILFLPALLTYNLQTSTRSKAIIVGYFTPWISAIAVAAVSIAFTYKFRTTNKAEPISIGSDLWEWFLCSQILRAVSIISACVPYLRKFIEAFPTGLLQADEIRRHGLRYADIVHGFTASQQETGQTVYCIRDIRGSVNSMDGNEPKDLGPFVLKKTVMPLQPETKESSEQSDHNHSTPS